MFKSTLSKKLTNDGIIRVGRVYDLRGVAQIRYSRGRKSFFLSMGIQGSFTLLCALTSPTAGLVSLAQRQVVHRDRKHRSTFIIYCKLEENEGAKINPKMQKFTRAKREQITHLRRVSKEKACVWRYICLHLVPYLPCKDWRLQFRPESRNG